MSRVNALQRTYEPYPNADLDAANLALSNARGLLEMLWVLTDGVRLPETSGSSLQTAIFCVQEEVERARRALFGQAEEVGS